MTPKLICENYRCKIGDKGEVRVFGMTEYTGGERSAPGQYMAIVYVPGEPPEKFDTDSFENAVAMVAKAFGEPEDVVRDALKASIPGSKRMFTGGLLAGLPQTRRISPIQWLLRKFFALS